MNYLNVNTTYLLFKMDLNSEIYVDKSMLIEDVSKRIRKRGRYICITRPRRFGKSMNLHMLGAYYTEGLDCTELFRDLKISRAECYEKHRNRHNVIYIDFSRMPDMCDNYKDYMDSIIRGLREDLQKAYPAVKEGSYDSVGSMLLATGDSFLFLPGTTGIA